MALLTDDFPHIDRSVKHIGISKLRGFNADKLRETDETFVIQENDTPLAVLVNYEKFLIMQDQLRQVMNTLDLLCDADEVEQLKTGLREAGEGKSRSIAEIRAGLIDRRKA